MHDIRFSFLDKACAAEVLPSLFDLYYRNMRDVADLGEYADERGEWVAEVGRAIGREPRRIALIFCGEDVVGFFMYYVNDGLFMMEEIQLEPDIQGKGAFRGLYSWLLPQFSDGIERVAAFTNLKNERSQSILRHFGFRRVDVGDRPFLRYESDYPAFAANFI